MSRLLMMSILLTGMLGIVFPRPVHAEDRVLRLYADPQLVEGGLTGYLLPRFRFKTRIETDMVDVPEAAGLLLIPEAQADGMADVVYRQSLLRAEADDTIFVLVIPQYQAEALAFSGWLQSTAGKRAIERHRDQGEAVFLPYEADRSSTSTRESAETDASLETGRKLTFFHCGRCHVIDSSNKYAGIGSTPSFAAMRNLPDWHDKFSAFWTLNPHPSFTQVEGITAPFPIERPPSIAPIELTLEEVEAIVSFTGSIPPKDLGAQVQSQ